MGRRPAGGLGVGTSCQRPIAAMVGISGGATVTMGMIDLPAF
jgi:hypothetical protein